LQEFRYCSLTFVGDVHEVLADSLIENNKILKYLKDNQIDNLEFIKTSVLDKLAKLVDEKGLPKKVAGYQKNDGVFMNFLSFGVLEEIYDVAPLYLLQRSDVENPKFGLDSIFFKDDEVFVFEFKSSINKLDEKAVAKNIREGVNSLFCKGDRIKTASLFDCKTNIKNNNLNSKIGEVIDNFIDNRSDALALINQQGLKFNVCIISPNDVFSEDEIKNHIISEYIKCKKCVGECKSIKCPSHKDIKILEAVHVQLPTEFKLEKLYEKLIARLSDGN